MKRYVHKRMPLLIAAALLTLALTGCRPYKQDAAGLLTGALNSYTWSSDDANHINKALILLNGELENCYWVDDNHLTAAGGAYVFGKDAMAVNALQKVNAGAATVINDAIADIAQGDLGVAGTLVQDAEASATSDPAEVALAEAAWDDAYAAYGSADFIGVVLYSEEAWRHARNALHLPTH